MEVKVTPYSEQRAHGSVGELSGLTQDSTATSPSAGNERQEQALWGSGTREGDVLADTGSETRHDMRPGASLHQGEPSAAPRGGPLCPGAWRTSTEEAAPARQRCERRCPRRTPTSHPVRNGECGRAPKGKAQSSQLTDVSLSSPPESHKRQHGTYRVCRHQG